MLVPSSKCLSSLDSGIPQSQRFIFRCKILRVWRTNKRSLLLPLSELKIHRVRRIRIFHPKRLEDKAEPVCMNHSGSQPVGCVAESGQPRRIKYFVRQAAIKLSISAAVYGRRIFHRPTLTNIVTNLKGREREREGNEGNWKEGREGEGWFLVLGISRCKNQWRDRLSTCKKISEIWNSEEKEFCLISRWCKRYNIRLNQFSSKLFSFQSLKYLPSNLSLLFHERKEIERVSSSKRSRPSPFLQINKKSYLKNQK